MSTVVEYRSGYTYFTEEKLSNGLVKVTENFCGRSPYISKYLAYNGKPIINSTHKLISVFYKIEVETIYRSEGEDNSYFICEYNTIPFEQEATIVEKNRFYTKLKKYRVLEKITLTR